MNPDNILYTEYPFLFNKYTKVYFKIIKKAKESFRKKSKETYYESHHIFPKSFGGNNSKNNKILLTAREHYIVHWLLIKICINTKFRIKMINAFWLMNIDENKNRYKNSRGYEIARKQHGENMSKRIISQETREKLRIINTGKINGPRSQEIKLKISKSNQGKTVSLESRNKMSNSKKGIPSKFKNIPRTEELKRKVSETHIKNGNLKGRNNPMYGKSVLDVWIEKYGLEIANEKWQKMCIKRRKKRTKPVSEETKIKIGNARKDKRHSDEAKRKIGEKSKGRIPWNKGLKIKH